MESYNANDERMRAKMIDRIEEVQQELDDPEVTYVKIGRIPKRGHEFETNGLKFKVITSNAKKGKFAAELYNQKIRSIKNG
jgi:CBS domain containing-hemolysin-like protein